MIGAGGHGGWDTYVSEARALVNVIEQELAVLGGMGSGGRDEKEVDVVRAEVEDLLDALDKLNKGMDADTLSHGERMQLERFEILHLDNKTELERTMKSVTARHKRERLLTDIHSSIQEYSTTQQLLEEEAEDIERAMRRVTDIYQEASASHAALLHNNTILSRISSRTRELAANVPVIHHVLNKIHQRTNRDQLILSSVVAFCLFVIWVFY
eukprot:TRINITY_DN30303_c0_g1_i1.p1 TRINITY_DN30303_c0_g1~~TRINITY_DN30303_c0_g1_i1.p1  ORF type:complete len:241 (+),score=19.12 TRINITY_DN30303_c0_g1_i1:89-724(+)